MAKAVKTLIKLNLPAGAATPAPPVGPALGQHGIPIMDFVKAYNARTEKQKGQVIPVVITVYEDRSFDFITKLPPVSELIKKKINLTKGASKIGTEIVGTMTMEQAREVATEKMPDLNAHDVDAATKIVIGTARSMGVEVKE